MDSTSKAAGECGPATCQYIWRSGPEGRSWGEPAVLPLRGIVPDKYRVLSNGREIISAHAKNLETRKLEQYLWYSDNGGRSWSERVTVASDPRYNLCEASILELCDGVLVAFMRENSKMGVDCLKSISYDGGESWQGVFHTPIPGAHRPVAGRLSGRVFMTTDFCKGKAGWGALRICLPLSPERALGDRARAVGKDHAG